MVHMAEAVHVDVAVLFGPTVEGFGYAPFRSGSRAFSAKVGCRPCSKSDISNCRYGDKLCFEKIDNAAVISFIHQKIKKPILAET